MQDFPGGQVIKNSPYNAGDLGLILVRSQGSDPTCLGTAKMVYHNQRSHVSQLRPNAAK